MRTRARTESLKKTEIIAAYVLLKEKVCTQTDPEMLCFGVRLAIYFVLFTQTVVRNLCFYISDDSLFVFCINLLIFPPKREFFPRAQFQSVMKQILVYNQLSSNVQKNCIHKFCEKNFSATSFSTAAGNLLFSH